MEEKLQEFDYLLIGYLSNTLSHEEMERLSVLLKSDASYRERYEEMVKSHAQSFIPRFEREKRSNYLRLSKALGFNTPLKTSKKFFQTFRRVAAIIVLIITSSVAIYYMHKYMSISNQDSQLVEMEVPPGSQTKVILPDGSVVFLNSGSILKYDVSYANRKTREVHLSGEGYFEVKRDEERPFIVHAQELNAKVLGTEFDVRAYQEDPEIEVNLMTGSLNVYSDSETNGNIVLSPNERLVYNRKTKKMWSSKTNASLAIRWITGRISFVNIPLLDVISEFEKKYNVKINIKTEKMKNEIFSGSISTKFSIDEILDYIDVDKKYKWTQKNDTINITDR